MDFCKRCGILAHADIDIAILIVINLGIGRNLPVVENMALAIENNLKPGAVFDLAESVFAVTANLKRQGVANLRRILTVFYGGRHSRAARQH